MTVPRLLLAGDDGTAWRPLGLWVAASITLPGGHAETDEMQLAADILQAQPATRLLYFAGRPAHALQGEAAGDPAGALSIWARRAQAVLRLVHAHPGRCLLVDVDDAAGRPGDLLAGVADWLEAVPEPSGTPPDRPQDPDTLWALVTTACVAARGEIDVLAQEWLASCVPLGPASSSALPAAADGALKALARLRGDLAETSAALHQARSERDQQARLHAEQAVWARALERDVQRLEEAVASLDGESVRQRERHDAALDRVGQLEADLVLHRAQIAQLLDDNDTLVGKLSAAQASIADQSAAREDAERRLATATDELGQTRFERQHMADELHAARASADQARLDLAALHAELETLTANLLQARSDAAAAQALAEQPSTPPAAPSTTETAEGSLQPLSVSGISLTRLRDEAPHREVEFRLSGALTPRGEQRSLDVRLVDHLGHPGLVLFGETTHPPFAGWRCTGQEDGREYMLIVPSDAAGPRALEPLPAADWAFLRRLSALLIVAAEEPGLGLRPVWRQIAQRLCLHFDSLPPRLRYDSMHVDVQGDGSCMVRLAGATWGGLALADVRLRWRPDGGQGADPAACALAWLLPEDPDTPPLLTLWPEADDGSLQPAWPLAVGAGFDAGARRRWWNMQPDADRALLLAVLDALPAAADAAQQPGWRAAAAELHAQARRTLRALRLRATLRRLRRR